jgi:hypothetical protein
VSPYGPKTAVASPSRRTEMRRVRSRLSGKLRTFPRFRGRVRNCAAGLPIIGIARPALRIAPISCSEERLVNESREREGSVLAEANSPWANIAERKHHRPVGRSLHPRGVR